MRRKVAAILHDEEPLREFRPEVRAYDVEAVRLRHAVEAVFRVRDDVEDSDEGVVALAPLHGVVVGALVGYDDEALAVLAGPDLDAFEVGLEVLARAFAAAATLIVTRDRDLSDLGSFR